MISDIDDPYRNGTFCQFDDECTCNRCKEKPTLEAYCYECNVGGYIDEKTAAKIKKDGCLHCGSNRINVYG